MPIAFGEPFSFDQTRPAAPAASEAVAERRVRVLIIGAGLAGLTCAYRLAQTGSNDLLVLEREPQVGGRIRSLSVEGAAVNLGAVTFQPLHYPRYMALLADLGLAQRIRPVQRRAMVVGVGGRATRADNAALAWDGLKGLLGRGVFTTGEAVELLRFYVFMRRVTAPQGWDELMALHAESVEAWAQRFGLRASLRRKFVEPFVHFCFAGPDQVSAAFGLYLLGFNLSHPATLEGGFSQVAEAMASRLPERVLTDAAVVAVERVPAGFVTTFHQHGLRCRVRSAAVVAAVPANVAARLLPELGARAGEVAYGTGQASLIAGRLTAPFELHLRRVDGPAGVTILGGEARAAGDHHLVNVLTYRGRCEPEHLRPLFAGGAFRVLAEYSLCPAVAAPAPGQTPLPVEWGDGLFLAGDCTGLFPSQEAAVSSGEEVARHLHHG
jgi:glycine/D-amino acid oxidase-like deaminating enzyme